MFWKPTIDVTAPEIQGLVGAKFSFKTGAAGSGEITYSSEIPIPIGYKAFRLVKTEDGIQLEILAAAGGYAFASRSQPVKPVLWAGELVDLEC